MSFQEWLALDDTRLARAAVKLTHVGEQTRPFPSVVIHSYLWLPQLRLFERFHSTGISYGNDRMPRIAVFSVTAGELRKVVNVALAARRDPSLRAVLSFTSLADTPEGIVGDEMRFAFDEARTLHESIGATFAANPIAQLALRQQSSAYMTE